MHCALKLIYRPRSREYGAADTVVVNGKVVSMDDPGYNNNPGHIYEAMAVKGNRIMALGANQQIRALGDKNTKVVDAGGRVIIPGIIETHAHLFGNGEIAAQMGIKSPDKGVNLTIKAGKDFESTRMNIENGIKGAVSKLQPGEWVNVGVNPNQQEGVLPAALRRGYRAESWSLGSASPPSRPRIP